MKNSLSYCKLQDESEVWKCGPSNGLRRSCSSSEPKHSGYTCHTPRHFEWDALIYSKLYRTRCDLLRRHFRQIELNLVWFVAAEREQASPELACVKWCLFSVWSSAEHSSLNYLSFHPSPKIFWDRRIEYFQIWINTPACSSVPRQNVSPRFFICSSFSNFSSVSIHILRAHRTKSTRKHLKTSGRDRYKD